MSALSWVLGGLIVAVLAARATYVIRTEKTKERGAPPGTGHHKLTSDYASGLGGGQSRDYKIPRDPQDYAKLFVPKDRK